MKDCSRFTSHLFGNFPPYGRGRHGDGCHRGRGGPIRHHPGHMHHEHVHHGQMKHGHDHKEHRHGHHQNKHKHHHGHHHMKRHHGHHFRGLMKGHRHFGLHKHSGRFQFGPDGRPSMEIGNCSSHPDMTKKVMKELMKHWIQKSRSCCPKDKCQEISKSKDHDSRNKEVVSETGFRSVPRRYSV